MYSAWLSRDEQPTYPRIDTLTPPDTIIRIGTDGRCNFVAHKDVLAAHSGYLKALLAATTESNESSTKDSSTPLVISVPTIGNYIFLSILS